MVGRRGVVCWFDYNAGQDDEGGQEHYSNEQAADYGGEQDDYGGGQDRQEIYDGRRADYGDSYRQALVPIFSNRGHTTVYPKTGRSF